TGGERPCSQLARHGFVIAVASFVREQSTKNCCWLKSSEDSSSTASCQLSSNPFWFLVHRSRTKEPTAILKPSAVRCMYGPSPASVIRGREESMGYQNKGF
ncbi:unnamed protein product, partial [Pylaiella littoralis]